MTDLPNYVEPSSCKDQYERVKFHFPFYRTELAMFDAKLSGIGYNEHKLNELKTSLVKVEDIRKAFSASPAWKQMWGNVESLLRSFVFKELVCTSTIRGLNYKLEEDMWSDYTSKMEFAILGLLWCAGSQY